MGGKVLTEEQAQVIVAFLEAFDLTVTGAWPAIEEVMIRDFGIEDPDTALTEAREALAG